MTKTDPLLGSHLSIAGGIPLALERAQKAGCRVLQIFVKNNNRWVGKVISEEEVLTFRRKWEQSKIQDVVAHDCYLLNLASPREDLWERSMDALIDEMERRDRLGLSYLVTHPGSHMGMGEEQGVSRIAQAIDRIHQKEDWKVRIALETTAGQGTSVGYRFEHLRDIIGAIHEPDRLAVCMDTCHIFAAGYDIREEEEYQKTMDRFDQTVGLEKLRVFHLNDSKREWGSRVDRHEHIGRGEIGTSGFAWILNDERLTEVPKILETPKGKTHREDKRNLKVLRALIQEV